MNIGKATSLGPCLRRDDGVYGDLPAKPHPAWLSTDLPANPLPQEAPRAPRVARGARYACAGVMTRMLATYFAKGPRSSETDRLDDGLCVKYADISTAVPYKQKVIFMQGQLIAKMKYASRKNFLFLLLICLTALSTEDVLAISYDQCLHVSKDGTHECTDAVPSQWAYSGNGWLTGTYNAVADSYGGAVSILEANALISGNYVCSYSITSSPSWAVFAGTYLGLIWHEVTTYSATVRFGTPEGCGSEPSSDTGKVYRDRTFSCPEGYFQSHDNQRNKLFCARPAEVPKQCTPIRTEFGNPVSSYECAKLQKEDDFRPITANSFSIERKYNSLSFDPYQPRGGLKTSSVFWRFNFEVSLRRVTDSVIAVSDITGTEYFYFENGVWLTHASGAQS
ncbi:MAG: hypothetical protein IPO35_18370 [Uliginosibacterium sp.]|nr:hypothetical protein [Uliginosibacterium sp.]